MFSWLDHMKSSVGENRLFPNSDIRGTRFRHFSCFSTIKTDKIGWYTFRNNYASKECTLRCYENNSSFQASGNYGDLKSPPQFHTPPPSVEHISSTQKGHSFEAPKIPQFHVKNPSVQYRKPLRPTQKPLSSTPKTPLFHTKNSSLQHNPQTKTVSNRGVFGVELRGVLYCGVFNVELRGRWNWGVFGVELRDFWC